MTPLRPFSAAFPVWLGCHIRRTAANAENQAISISYLTAPGPVTNP
jgi:hypothetical protein